MPLTVAQRDTIRRIARQHGARGVRVFGSFARGEERPGSDLDLLVEMEAHRSLIDSINLKTELERLLGRNVDVVTERALHPLMRTQVLREAVVL